ncbi:uncharacterized protein LOC142168301 [Nicotiana tabacum]|uniref:Uncharacterized protein LOC142168301 n=1 Tax=Nicotiana tabacum TaxID=4097 RepID=A0AC58SJB9_TOBAC
MTRDAFEMFPEALSEQNDEAKKFFKELEEASCPLYKGSVHSKLSVVVRLLQIKSDSYISQSGMNSIIGLMNKLNPSNIDLPKDFYIVKKLVSSLGLSSERIHCYENGCILLYKDDASLENCKFCNKSRYKKATNDKKKKILVKAVHYLPLIPKLKRLYASMSSAPHMGLHYENRRPDGVLRHPSDGEVWKHFDRGPHNPKKLIDIYMQPLIDELKLLWHQDVETYDISTKQNFRFCAALMWTINDFSTYIMMFEWSTVVKLACLTCVEDTKVFTLKHGGKNTWFDYHHHLLPIDHEFRRNTSAFMKNKIDYEEPPSVLSPEEIWNRVRDLPKVTEYPLSNKIHGYYVTHNWTKQSIFYELPYWKHNLLRHNIDVMLIENIFFDNLFNIVMDVNNKTKHNLKMHVTFNALPDRIWQPITEVRCVWQPALENQVNANFEKKA